MSLFKGHERFLVDQARLLNCDITLDQSELLIDWLEMIYDLEAGRRLTAVPVEFAVSRHLVDSMHAMEWMPRKGRVMDIGTGAGFPGVVIAVFRPDLKVILAERSQRVAAFLEKCIFRLGVSNVNVMCTDVRKSSIGKEEWDVITGRASLSPDAMVKVARKGLSMHGRLVMFLGPSTVTPFLMPTYSVKDFSIKGLKRYVLSGDSAEKWICCLEKTGMP